MPAPASNVAAATTDPSGATVGYATGSDGIWFIKRVGGLWTRTKTPYRGKVMDTATDNTGTYVAFTDLGTSSSSVEALRVGKRLASGRYVPSRVIASPFSWFPVFRSAALLASGGHWRVFYDYLGCSDVCGENRLQETDDAGRTWDIPSVPANLGEVTVFTRLKAAWMPNGVVALMGVTGGIDANTGGAQTTGGDVWFGRGTGHGYNGWAFGRLDRRADTTDVDVVSRYMTLFVTWGRPGTVMTITNNGRAWSAPRALPAAGAVAGTRTAVSLGHQYIAWSDSTGLRLAHRVLYGPWTTTTLTRAAQPRSLATTASSGLPTVVFSVQKVAGIEIRALTQR